MIAVWKRELLSYMKSPVGYVYMFLYLIISGSVFNVFNLQQGSSDVAYYFFFNCYTLILTVPLLTMKLFPEERKNKTDQILMTSPVSITGMVMGKFLAAYTLFVASLLPSVGAVLFLDFHGYIQPGIVIGSLIALLLMGAAYIAVSMLMACITESQIIAFMGGFFVLLLLNICSLLNDVIDNELVNKFINALAITSRYETLAQGLFDFTAIIYFISLTLVSIFLIVRVIDKRRWS